MTTDGAWSVSEQRRSGHSRLDAMRRLAARSRPGLAVRSMRRFRRIGGRDRALILAGQAFTTLIPVMILAAGVVGRSRGSALADGFVNRFQLAGGSADAVRVLFTRPPTATGAMSVVGLIVLLVSLLGFTRSLQGTYETAWDLAPRGLRGTLNGLGGTGLLVAQVIALGAVMSVLRGLPALPVLGTLTRMAAAFPLWLVLQYLLLSRRAPMRALWPGALVTAVVQGLVVLGSGIWMPSLMARNEARYGVIGVTFALLTWLIILAFAIVIAAVVGAEVGSSTGRTGVGAEVGSSTGPAGEAGTPSTHAPTPMDRPTTPGPGGDGG